MNEVEEVKNKIDIVDLIGGYLTLKKTGANYKALCPFHSEKTPSFMVSPERQSFKCFGCGKGGDIFTFIEEIEGMDFYDALKLLAGRAGVELKPRRGISSYGGKNLEPSEKSRIYEINELAAQLYHKILTIHPKVESARKYLKNRGIADQTIKDFQLGYAPNSWDFLIRALKTKNFSEKEIFRAGLLVLSDKGKYWDRFRGRIMFPISNISGQVIAFTGRTLDDKEVKAAKYINSAESPIYIKGKTIYALDRARIEIRSQGFSVMVEGNMDVLACHQAGFRNVVAVSGTALTSEQLKILSRYSPDIYFSFDSDSAGKAALKRAITLALQNDLSAHVIVLPGFKDPDEAIKKDLKIWQQAISAAKPALESWIDSLVLEYNGALGVDEKKKISKEILPVIKIIANEVEREHYIKYLAKKLAISESVIIDQLGKTKEIQRITKELNNGRTEEQKNPNTEKKLAGLVWQEPKLADKIPADFFQEKFSDPTVESLFAAIRHNQELKKLPRDVKSKIDLFALEATRDLDLEDQEIIEKEFQSLLENYREKQKEQIKEKYAEEIAAAEAAGDRKKIKELMSKFQSAIINKEN